MTSRQPARRAFLLWITLSALLYLTVRATFGTTPDPESLWRSGPANIAYLAISPARFIAKRILGFGPESSFIVACTLASAAYIIAVALTLALYKKLHRRAARTTNHGRRLFLTRATAAGAAFTATGTVAKATLVDPVDLRVVRYKVPIRDLPESLEGLRIAHLSDWHAGARVPLDVLEASTHAALQLKPDLFALTGDYIHSKIHELPAALALIKPLLEPTASRFGVVAVLGNHDYYADAPAISRALSELGVDMIDNKRRFLTAAGWTDSPTNALCIAGLADKWMDTPKPVVTLAGVHATAPRIVLAHQPDTAELPVFHKPNSPRIDLMLCGHTHGGQVRLPLLGTPVVPSNHGQKYAGGLVQGPAFPVLISRGIGMSVLPIRFGVPPEISEITLTRA